ncbi:unnamed protein product [Caenorhabditis angaria]|uniref:GCS light chain n=1 Tax=Caenorhabditis angaria TaxID=860376 RepID=A0A9P1I4Z8_9PELO|nr:unnamed protein product [Caenorhabditis angaria]
MGFVRRKRGENAKIDLTNNAVYETPCRHNFFLEKLTELKRFRLHTGNVNGYTQLKLRRFENSADELSACLDLQLTSTPIPAECKENSCLLLCDNDHIENYDRDEIKITMKVFMSSWNIGEIDEAVTSLKEQLKTQDIEVLIVSFPELELIDGESEEEELQRWFKQVKPIYEHLCNFVETSGISSIGVSDLSANQLKEILDNFDTKPLINHVRLDGCCQVPQELQTLAKDNDIQLLVHNDPSPFPGNNIFKVFCEIGGTGASSPVCNPLFKTTWLSRYSVWVRKRSIMTSKGYIVQLIRKDLDD